MVDACKGRGIPIRIGVNGGSLEKEILAKYGSPTPQALVESAQYHVKLLEKYDFDQIVISIVAGYATEDLKAGLGDSVRIVRSMPNTPAMVGEGMTGVCYDDALFSDEEKETIHQFFTSFGKMERVDEKLIDVVGSASGCSPAYVYMFIEALADGCVKNGLPRQTAYRIVAQAVLGSAKMVLETGKHPGELKDMVCSPGGTTIEGLAALEECGFRGAIIKACDANYEKNKKLK